MIVVTGGRIHMKEVWLYQVNMDQWIKGAPLNVARFKHRMVTCQGFIAIFNHFFCVVKHCFNEISGSAFVIGGLQGGGGISNVVTKLDSVERKSFKNS